MHSGARQVRKCHAKALSVLDLVVSPWPWPLTCWPQNLISSSLSRNALKLKCGETSTNSFKKYCEQTLSICHKKHSSTLPLLNSRDVNPTGTIHASLTLGDRSFPVAAARAWNTLLQHVRNVRLPPRTEDHSVPVVIPWCDLTMYCALSVCPSLSADLSPCTGCYKLILSTLYGGPIAALR